MPSIFIWKSETPNNSKKNIRVYLGSNWVLEDNDFSSKSYIYLEQIVIPGFNDSVITFHTKNMSQDWIGSDLLEVTTIPYELVKSDNYAAFEKIGEWSRVTLKNDIDFITQNLELEFQNIKKWINQKNKITTAPIYKNKPKDNTIKLDSHNIQLNFQEFLIKYNMPISDTMNFTKNNAIDNRNNTNKSKYNNKYTNKNKKILK